MPAVTLKLPEVKAQNKRKEGRVAFVASALQTRQEVAKHGQVMDAADVHKWLVARARSGKAARPRVRKLIK